MSWTFPNLPRPLLMGILNVTPDSFSDGGVHYRAEDAIAAGRKMVEDGADILDVGGESTRPNAQEVDEAEEIRRVLPVIQGLRHLPVALSIDTMKPAVAEAALDAGAHIVNDVTALGSPGMAELCARHECYVCLMHMQGSPRTMQANPSYDNVVEEIRSYLLGRAANVQQRGISKNKIWLDPGIGFGKNVEHNLDLLHSMSRFVDTDYPILLGVSRKSFIGKVLGGQNPLPSDERLEGTLAAQAWGQMKGVKVIRAHDVKASRRVIDMLARIGS